MDVALATTSMATEVQDDMMLMGDNVVAMLIGQDHYADSSVYVDDSHGNEDVYGDHSNTT
jgi:hypothetical protein